MTNFSALLAQGATNAWLFIPSAILLGGLHGLEPGHSKTMMAHCVSMLSDGVFEEFPTLKFAFIEGGTVWPPYVMGRLDRMYPALKAEVPYLTMLPSEYLLRNCYFSTQPIEEPDNHRHLLEMLKMMRGEKTVIFASDYPHWDFDNPLMAFNFFPADLKRRPYHQLLRRLDGAQESGAATAGNGLDVGGRICRQFGNLAGRLQQLSTQGPLAHDGGIVIHVHG